MLPEWYFCCCVRATPIASEAFLCTLEVLDTAISDHQLLRRAYGELCLFETRMQVYALPSVLRSLRRSGRPAELQTAVQPYFEALLRSLPMEVEGKHLSLRSLLSPDTSQRAQNLLDEGASACQSLLSREKTSTPYMDLTEFLPETLLLAVAVDLAERDPGAAAKVTAPLGEEKSPFRRLFAEALDGQFGRLAFLLAAQMIARVATPYNERMVLERIWKGAYPLVSVEPDLLQVTAELQFLHYSRRTEPDWAETACREMVAESRLLRCLRSLRSSVKSGDHLLPREHLRRLGFGAKLDHVDSLAIIYWQGVLWQLAAETHPMTAAGLLAEFWTLPTPPPWPLRFASDLPQAETEGWRQQLQGLLRLRTSHDLDITIDRTPCPSGSVPELAAFFSPWLLDRDSTPGQRRFQRSEQAPVMVRLVAAAGTAVRLLQMLHSQHPRRLELAALIAHAADVLDTYRIWLKQTDDKPSARVRSLNLALTRIARFGRQQTTEAGSGRLQAIPPDLFTELLYLEVDDNGAPGLAERTYEFRLHALPEVLIEWISDAYPGVTGREGPGQWLRLLPEVYEEHCRGEHSTLDKYHATALTRLLRPDYPLDLRDDRLDWREAHDTQGPMQWRVKAKQLLLTDRSLPPDQWVPPGWEDEPDWSATRLHGGKQVSVYDPQTPLVRSLERLASLDNPGELAPETREAWLLEWQSRLNSVTSAQQLDRLVRLRLLEIMDCRILQSSEVGVQGQELIAATLLEFGSAYEIGELFRRAFPFEADGRPSPVGAARQELQKYLLGAVFRLLEKETAEQERRRRPQDPRVTARNADRQRLLQDMVSTLALRAATAAGGTGAKILKDLRSSRAASGAGLNCEHRPPVSSGEPILPLLRAQRIFPQDATQPGEIEPLPGPGCIFRTACYDPNGRSLTVFYKDVDLSGVQSLFDLDWEQIHALFADAAEPVEVLGIVLQAWHDKGKPQCLLNCGIPQEIRALLALGATAGDCVRVPLLKVGERWQATGEARVLLRRRRPGDRTWLSVMEHRMGRQRRPHLRLPNGEYVPGDIDLERWDADTSRLFRASGSTETWWVPVEWDEEHGWVPLDGRLLDLMLDLDQQAVRDGAVATLLGEIENTDGETAWRLSTRPGQNYVVRSREWVTEDAEHLRREVSRIRQASRGHQANGLLLTIRPTLQEDRVLLCLVYSRPAGAEAYPDLKMPFDYRNLEWQNLMAPGQYGMAFSENGDWWVRTAQPATLPFPDRLRVESPVWVEWRDQLRRRPEDGRQIQFQVERWEEYEQRSGTLLASRVLLRRIDIEPGQRLALIRQLLGRAPLGRVTLRPGKLHAGRNARYLLAWTQENIRVEVEAESVTMRPLDRSALPPLTKPRPAEVIADVRWVVETSLHPVIEKTTELPSEAVRAGKCQGIIAGVPREDTQRFEVLWVAEDNVVERRPEIIDLPPDRVRPGYRLEGELYGDRWVFHVRRPVIRVRALWERISAEGRQDLYAIGSVRDDAGVQEAFEVEPGRFILRQRHEAPGANHGAGESPASAHRPIWEVERSHPHEHCLILGRGEDILVGHHPAGCVNGNVQIERTWLTPEWRSDGLCALRREWRLRWHSPREQRQTPSGETIESNWQQRLDVYWLRRWQDRRLRARRGVRAGVPGVQLEAEEADEEIQVLNPESGQWEPWVPLAPGEEALVGEAIYDDDAWVVLEQVEDKGQIRVVASYRKVPPLSPEEYRRCLNAQWGESISVPEKLFYVAPEAVEDPESPGLRMPEARPDFPPRTTHYRFEFGYGKTLRIPEAQLLFDGRPFRTTSLLLFRGDAIERVTFRQAADIVDHGVDGAGTQAKSLAPEACVVDVDTVHLQLELSEAHALYNQKKAGIVHLLHLVIHLDRVEVRSVDGLDEIGSEDRRSFSRVRSGLDPKSEQGLRRLHAKGELGRDPVIYGRLNKTLFEQTFGTVVQFEHVALSLWGVRPLLKGELVFLQINEVRPIPNDILLLLGPPGNFISPEDAETLDGDIALPRRHFSVREDLLPRIHANNRSHDLINHLVLACLTPSGEHGISASLVRSAPTRRLSVLSDTVRQQGVVLAAVADVASSPGADLERRCLVKLELHPGIYVALREEELELESLPPDLIRGTIVRVEQVLEPEVGEPGHCRPRYRFSRAVFPEMRYLTDGQSKQSAGEIGAEVGLMRIRPAVLLPMNDLLRWLEEGNADIRDWRLWAEKARFTIGGLPGISALPGVYDPEEGSWAPPAPGPFAAMMRRPHPKIGQVGVDARGEPRVTAELPDLRVGRLHIDTQLKAFYVSILRSGEARPYPVPWRLLTYGDLPAKQVIEELDEATWEYHDARSGYVENGRLQREWLPGYGPMPAHSSRTGPLFFEPHGNELRLRYDPSDFRRFGFPVGELIQVLTSRSRKGQEPTFTVAGVSDTPEGGLWIEISPGRLVELPGPLLVWQSAPSQQHANGGRTRRKPHSLARLHWQAFGPGDRVKLELDSEDALALERVVLRYWTASPRRVLGNIAILPVQDWDVANGGLVLGAGEFTVTLPEAQPNPAIRTYLLQSDNRLKPVVNLDAEAPWLHGNCAALLQVDETGKVGIAGWPGRNIRIHSQDTGWHDDPLATRVVQSTADGLVVRIGALKALIRKAGGALPVTVEGVSEWGSVLFSFRLQHEAAVIPPGRTSMARMVDLLDDKSTALLHCGSALLVAPMARIVSGIPGKFYQQAAEALRETGEVIWLRGRERGGFDIGLDVDTRTEILVRGVCAVSLEDSGYPGGLICRALESELLYWLPWERIGWIDLDADDVRVLGTERRGTTFRAARIGSRQGDYISVVDVGEVRGDLAALTPGTQLLVTVVGNEKTDVGDTRYCLAETHGTRLVLKCEVFGDRRLRSGDEIDVEVTHRELGIKPSVTVAPVNAVPYRLDLPHWATDGMPPPDYWQEQFHASHAQEQDGVNLEQPMANLPVLGSEILDQRLRVAYEVYEATGPGDYVPLWPEQVAEEWVRRRQTDPPTELSAELGIKAMLLLARSRDENKGVRNRRWRQASEWTVEMGARALRSMHVEILVNEWLSHPDRRRRSDGLWVRLRQIEHSLQHPVSLDGVQGARHFGRAVFLRGSGALNAIAAGLSASIGEVPNPMLLCRTDLAPVTTRLAEVYRGLAPTGRPGRLWLQHSHVALLKQALSIIVSVERDVVLLSPPVIGGHPVEDAF